MLLYVLNLCHYPTWNQMLWWEEYLINEYDEWYLKLIHSTYWSFSMSSHVLNFQMKFLARLNLHIELELLSQMQSNDYFYSVQET